MTIGRRFAGPGLRRRARVADQLGSVWLPSDITGVSEWWRADLGVSTSGSAVTTWTGQVNGEAPTQGTEANRPTLGTRDGQSAISFDGGDFLQAAFATITITQPHTIVAVSESTGGTGVRYVVEGDDAANQSSVGINATQFTMYAGTFRNGGTPSAMHAQVCEFNGASSVHRADDFTTSVASGEAGAETPDGITVGANVAGSANFWTGWIWEIIYIDQIITSADLASLGAYLDDRYPSLSLTY